VRLIFDAIGALGIDPAFLNRLRNAGVQLLEYHPVAPWRPRWAWGRRDHRKILVVDGRTAFTGGVNIWDAHAPVSEGGSDWRDAHVRLEGPAVQELERLFRAVWYKETRRSFKLHPAGDARGESRVRVAANQEFLHRYSIHSAYLNALRAAREEVLIANAYFLPGRRIRAALAGAARRGVSVKILAQGRPDVLAAWLASRALYDGLLKSGVRLFAWPGPILHEKTAVVDGLWSAIGSYNMDHRSLKHNLEVNLHILDRDFARRLSSWMKEGIAQSPELVLEQWRRRPAIEKLMEQCLYQFHYFF
jgi:cardiolipin synthase